MIGVTVKLAQSVSTIEFEALPPSTVRKVKEILLDSIGCALGGYVTERAKTAIKLGEALGIKPEATVIGHKKLSYLAASFVNGELINCLDFDVVGPLLGHVVPMVIPPTLAIGEKIEASGKDFITALAIGIEVGNRVGGSLSGRSGGLRTNRLTMKKHLDPRIIQRSLVPLPVPASCSG